MNPRLSTLALASLLAPLAACPSASAPPVVPTAPAPPPAEPAPVLRADPAPGSCLELGADKYAYGPVLEYPELADPQTLTFCRLEAEGHACYAADLDSGALSPRPVPAGYADREWPGRPLPASFKLSEDRKGAQLCGDGGRCRALPITPRGAYIEAVSVSADQRHAALTVVVDEQYYIQLFALPSGRPGKRITVSRSPYPCASGSFIGNTLLVEQNICAGPAGYSWLASPTSARRIAWVGGEGFDSYAPMPVHVQGDLWAFREGRGLAVVVQDVVTGAIAHQIDLSATVPKDEEGTPMADPTGGAMLDNRARGELVLVHDGPAQGSVVRVDPTQGRIVKALVLPRCGR